MSVKSKSRVKRKPFVARFELLEPRALLAATIPGVTLDPALVPKFVNAVPNALDPSFVYTPVGYDNTPSAKNVPVYKVGAYQTQQDLGLGLVKNGTPVKTTVWGYGTSQATATYPGRTFVAKTCQPIEVGWSNNLGANGKPLPHLLQDAVDTSICIAGPMDPQSPLYGSGVPIVPHLHGGHTEVAYDGLPEQWFTPYLPNANGQWTRQTGPDFKGDVYWYDNSQQAGTIWYHDHALGITRLNVYAGLAGFYIIRDPVPTSSSPNKYADTGVPDDPKTTKINENPLGLPTGPYEIPLAIQDRMFTTAGQLYYPADHKGDPGFPTDPSFSSNASLGVETFGDTILVNGKAWPKLDVEPRQYRFRLLNGSDSRFYNFWIEQQGANNPTAGITFLQIGTDDGLLYKPVSLKNLVLGPGERADIIVDFSKLAGKKLVLRNNAATPYNPDPVDAPPLVISGPSADPCSQIMLFNVGTKTLNLKQYPLTSVSTSTQLRAAPIAPLVQNGPTRQLLLFETQDEFGRTMPLLGTAQQGGLHYMDATTEKPLLNNTEVWEIYNTTMDTHPIHLHLVSFQIVSRQDVDITTNNAQDPTTGALDMSKVIFGATHAPAANESGWKDTVQMNPGQVTRIRAKFDRPGEYMWHCHILSHEENDMMRKFEVVTDPNQATNGSGMSMKTAARLAATTAEQPSAPAAAPTAQPVAPAATSTARLDPVYTLLAADQSAQAQLGSVTAKRKTTQAVDQALFAGWNLPWTNPLGS